VAVLARTDERRLGRVLADARAGSDVAMRALFRDVQPRLLRFLHAMEPAVADDLASEVWMSVARGLRAFEGGPVEFRAWVFSIARRRVSEHRRRTLRTGTEAQEQAVFEAVPSRDDLESMVLGRIAGSQAASMLASMLPPDQAEVVLLRVLADLDVDTVAALMGRTANWVRVTQHRALQRLADRLGSRVEVIR
jgi:RNA polymerase sigma-70 factor (ECF subfamily)